MAAHFATSLAGSLLSSRAPRTAALLHLLAGISYWADSTHRAELLRRLCPAPRSHNLLATLPAEGELRRRVVVLAHVDAAFSGLLFHPRLARWFAKGELPPWLAPLERPLRLATHAQFALAALDLLRAAGLARSGWGSAVNALLSAPAAIGLAVAADVLRRNQVVAGANDDLSGVAGALLLARRLERSRPDGLEVVLAFTGAEEAGLGGARALARAKADSWDPAITVALGLDGLGNGKLCYFEEGEVERAPVPDWLRELLRSVAASEPRFAGLQPHVIPVGGTDVYAFRRRGYDGVCLGFVDPELGAPRHYHWPSDTPENLDLSGFVDAVDFAERLIWKLGEAG